MISGEPQESLAANTFFNIQLPILIMTKYELRANGQKLSHEKSTINHYPTWTTIVWLSTKGK
eukprot:c35868_g1_i1 orf=153-338(+)